MVRISIVGAGETAEYLDGSNTKAVQETLLGAFGKGILMQNGLGIVSETLTGDYQYHVTGTSGSRVSAESRPVLANDSEKIGVLLKPDCSASAIANHYPEIYDVFAQICGPGSYVPNSRLQQLLEAPVLDKSAIIFKCELVRSLVSVDTFRNASQGSETMMADSNLQTMLSIMASYSDESLTSAQPLIPSSSMYLAGSVSSPGHSLFSRNGPQGIPHVVGAEAEGMEESVRQLITVCGNSCLELNRIGLSHEDCVVPGVAMAGNSCQFLAMYLLRDSFPVLVALSPILCPFGTWGEQEEVAKWCLRLVAFARETADKVQHCQCIRSPRDMRALKVCLNMCGYFVKPIRNGLKFTMEETYESDETILYSDCSIRLNEIMRMYEQLRVSGLRNGIDMGRLLIFPEGVVSVPDEGVRESEQLRKVLMRECYINGFRTVDLTFRPLILFPRLSPSDGWTDAKPALGIIQQLYLEQLKLAIDALNTAGIAHLDLRPANALWRSIHTGDTPSVELRLIDFEDAVPFGQVIPPELVRVIVDSNDYRYPFQSGDEHSDQIARVLHNEFFFEAIGRWTSSEVIEFTEFMQDGTGLDILHSLLAP